VKAGPERNEDDAEEREIADLRKVNQQRVTPQRPLIYETELSSKTKMNAIGNCAGGSNRVDADVPGRCRFHFRGSVYGNKSSNSH
jgi:hypothetical protein